MVKMPSKERKRKAKRKETNNKYYTKNKDSIVAKSKEYYNALREEKKDSLYKYPML